MLLLDIYDIEKKAALNSTLKYVFIWISMIYVGAKK